MTLGHRLIGTGPEHVIVLHGWLADHTVFEPLFACLDTENFTYLFPDYRGYGLSRDQSGAYTIAEIGQDILALADHLGWERFHLIGHSMGGMVMQWVIAHAPQRVKSGVGINPVPASGVPLDPDGWALFASAADTPSSRGAIIMLTTGNRHSPAWERMMIARSLATTTRDAFASYLTAWAKSDFSAEVAGQQTPLKVLVGEHDPALTAEVMQQTIIQWFPNASLETLSNAGHYPMIEIPVNLATLCEAWMREHS